jgi:shikimate dehydrogenase
MPATTAPTPGQLGPACLVGLIGAGIQASRTPAMHEQEGAEQGLRCIYKLVDCRPLVSVPRRSRTC